MGVIDRSREGEEGRDQEGGACGGADGGGGEPWSARVVHKREANRVWNSGIGGHHYPVHEANRSVAHRLSFHEHCHQGGLLNSFCETQIPIFFNFILSKLFWVVLQEIGDFENWMKIMEFDCKSITAAIHNIHQAWVWASCFTPCNFWSTVFCEIILSSYYSLVHLNHRFTVDMGVS